MFQPTNKALTSELIRNTCAQYFDILCFIKTFQNVAFGWLLLLLLWSESR